MPTQTAKTVLALGVFAAVAVILLNPIISTVNGHTGVQSIENETVAAQFDESVDLQGYDIDNSSETVWAYNDTSGSYEQATEGTDYKLNPGPGTIELYNTSLVDSGEDVKVSYDYQATGDLAALVLGFLPIGVALFIFVNISNAVQRVMG